MAKLSTMALVLTITCLLVASKSGVDATRQGSVEEEDAGFLREVCDGKENVIRLRFYVQDRAQNTPNTTVYEVARASITANSSTSFGSVVVIDDLLTEGPEADSRALGRIQGMNTRSDLSVIGITVSLNIYFTAGRFNGSTISVIGRNEFLQPKRELPVAGGTGAFRFARGYAIQTTHSRRTNVIVLEYNIYTTYNTTFVEPSEVEVAEM